MTKLSIEQIKIYESFQLNKGCSLCKVLEDYEDKVLNAISQDLVMDLEFFPKFGKEYTFCDRHMGKFDEIRDKLGMAIMIKKLITMEIMKIESASLEKKKRLSFNKSKKEMKCFVCEKINEKTMNYDVKRTIDLWSENEEFKKIYSLQNNFCIKHFNLLLSKGKEILSPSEFKLFKKVTCNIQLKYCKELELDIEWFIKKYDYRFKNEPWNNAKDSINRAKDILKRSKS
ncbi:hypothetical protein JCM1393_29570 [Clostridium carnis]